MQERYAPKGCKLYYNDFNEYMDKKDAIVKLTEEINADGHYIDGIGMQSHLNVTNNGEPTPYPSVGQYRQALEKQLHLQQQLQPHLRLLQLFRKKYSTAR